MYNEEVLRYLGKIDRLSVFLCKKSHAVRLLVGKDDGPFERILIATKHRQRHSNSTPHFSQCYWFKLMIQE